MKRQRWANWGLVLCGWTFFAIFFATQSLLYQAYSGTPVNWRQTLVEWLVYSCIWAALTPLVLHLSRRYRIERSQWLGCVFVHLFTGMLVSIAHVGAYVLIFLPYRWLPAADPASPLSVFQTLLAFELHADLLTYWAIVGVDHAIDYHRKYRERELEASQLEARLAETRLLVLKSQLQPHFLFNTLNTISVLMAEDVSAANRILILLSDLLRTTLKDTAAQQVPLAREIELLGAYLEIERIRFQDRLKVVIDVDPSALEAYVPNMILQPLAENAIRHGIARIATAGILEIRATRRDQTLRLLLHDNGPGLSESAVEGVGLTNTRARLAQLYGEAHRFELHNDINGGLTASLTIPFRTASGGS